MDGIEIKRIRTLRGASIWAYCPVLEIHVDIGKYEDLPSDQLPGFADRLAEAIPSLWEHRCSEGHPGGFFERLREGTYMGHILEHVILELQSLAGMATNFGRTRSATKRGEYYIIIHYRDEEAGKMCARLGLEIVQRLAAGEPLGFSVAERIASIRQVAEDNMIGPSTQAIIDAARRRNIPWFRLNNGSLIQLGHGKHARRIQASETSLTANIAVEIAADKELTKELLTRVGVPVPEGSVVNTADEAWEAALELGGPVVVKPADGNQGRGVSVHISGEEQVRQAFELAQAEARSPDVIVERFIEGSDHRLLVVNGKMVAAAQRRPAQVVGDGLHKVGELVEMVNADPRRGHGHGAVLTRIKIDPAAELTLAKQGLTLESVPLAGAVVLLRDNSNLSTGGTAIDVTDEVHPDNACLAELAAETIGLDIAGVDVVCQSLRRPLAEQGGAIVEVNAAPGLRMHIAPSEGKARLVGRDVVDMLFPPGAPTRVPLIAVTGTNGKTTVTRMIGHIYSTMKLFVGMTSTDGVYFEGVRRVKADASGPRSAEAVLQHPRVEVAVLETARGGILRAGLAWDEALVGVVLNVAGDHLGIGGVDTLEQLARVKRVVVESVAADGFGVLNADDPLVVEMADYCTGRLIYFATARSSPVLRDHIDAGGRGAFIEDGQIVLAHGDEETALLPVVEIPATHGGVIPFQVQNALAAAAACWGAGVHLDSIRLGLRTFQADDSTAPGRFNIFDLGEMRLIVDYGHNPHAFRAMQAAIRQMRPLRAVGVIGAPGDRRDEDIEEVARIAAETFDQIIIREDTDPRGRERGELATLIGHAVASVRPDMPVRVVLNELESLEEALNTCREGDVVVFFADKVDAVLARVRREMAAAQVPDPGYTWQAVEDAHRPGEIAVSPPH